jgi:phosphoribosyl 1,2-cyclic phosphodiesterase
MRFASLGSGSRGNALVVECGRSRVLLDCGFSLGETISRLSRVGVAAEELDAIVVTHEHDDHIGGVARLARRFDLPVWLTGGTLAGFEPLFDGVQTRLIRDYRPFEVGDIEVQPFPVPHDAREPAQYVFVGGRRRLGVLTDAGGSTRHIERMLSGCDALMLECNHDPDMLRESSYPQPLKDRISGRHGHLDNAAAAQLLARLDRSRLQKVVAAHLSQQNNRPELACAAMGAVLGEQSGCIQVAEQDRGFDWIAID